jgi:hypothetical protein
MLEYCIRDAILDGGRPFAHQMSSECKTSKSNGRSQKIRETEEMHDEE